MLLLSFEYFPIGQGSGQSSARCPLQESSPGPVRGTYHRETRGGGSKFANADVTGRIESRCVTSMIKKERFNNKSMLFDVIYRRLDLTKIV